MLRFPMRLAAGLLMLTMASGQVSYEFDDGTGKHRYELAPAESKPGNSAMRRNPAAQAAQDAPVFYDMRELPSKSKLNAMSGSARNRRLNAARRIMTKSLLVKMEAARFEELAPTGAIGHEPSLLDGWRLVRYATPQAALDAVNWMMRAGGWQFTPVFAKQMEKRQALRRAVTDPLYPNQWHLMPSGFNLSMKDAWDSVTGKGINIAVVDDGLDMRHEDLRDNAYPIDSGYHINFNDGPIEDPTPLSPEESHGTACAGLAAASGFNNRGVAGVAPEARLMGLRLIAGPADDEAEGIAMAWQPRGIVTHVSSNSWGPADDAQDLGRSGPLRMAGMRKAVTEYRNGLGTIFVISAGNGRGAGDNSSYDGFSSSRYAIGVAAVNRNGEQSSYSENGMNVAISALGGEFDPPGVMWTTNVSGEAAFALKAEKFPASRAPLHYTDAFNGTSAAAPQISGTAALLLEKNPRLGYRDVKEILIRTANRDGLKGSDPFETNGAGIPFSHSFGAGLVNVAAAVDRAGSWRNLGPLVSAEVVSRGTAPLADGEPMIMEFDFSVFPDVRIEHVELVVNVAHENRGDLGFGILAPSGMRSLADPRPPDEGADFENYMFTSVRHWGESSKGTWKVLVADTVKNGVGGEVGRVTLRVYGTER